VKEAKKSKFYRFIRLMGLKEGLMLQYSSKLFFIVNMSTIFGRLFSIAMSIGV